MSLYQFVPSPDLSTRETNLMTWENGFSDSQISQIITIGEECTKTEATVGASGGSLEEVPLIRKSEIGWIGLNDRTSWMYDSLAYISRQINGQFFGFELYGFVEDFQYTIYRPDGDHYNWHIDKGMINNAPRKLSMVLQLSDPSEYEGGDLQFYVQSEPINAEKKKGLIYIFPSWILHRVTPVTRGTRRSLVVWITGPKFK
jgi:PKHD-type hydroxylase